MSIAESVKMHELQEIDGHNLLSKAESVKNAKTELSKYQAIIIYTNTINKLEQVLLIMMQK